MKIAPLIPALTLIVAGSFVRAETLTDSVVQELATEGYSYIELRRSGSRLKVEAFRGKSKLERVYATEDGELLVEDTEEVDDETAEEISEIVERHHNGGKRGGPRGWASETDETTTDETTTDDATTDETTTDETTSEDDTTTDDSSDEETTEDTTDTTAGRHRGSYGEKRERAHGRHYHDEETTDDTAEDDTSEDDTSEDDSSDTTETTDSDA